MRYLVLGSGMMGFALAFDLARSEGTESVTLADIDEARARKAASTIPGGNVTPLAVDVNDRDAVVRAMRNHTVAIGAVSYRMNVDLSKAAIAAGVHFCDLGGNDSVVRAQLGLHDAAVDRHMTIVPNCGLAPGLVNILGARGAQAFERVDAIRMRVGGLPQHPVPPLNYQLVFSAEGLINEYSGTSTVLREGVVTEVPALTEVEMFDVPPLETLEAFHTSGGVSLLPQMFAGKVRELDYKTVRYPGHVERIRMLFEMGFAGTELLTVGTAPLTPRAFLIEFLKQRLPSSGLDLVVLLATIDGIAQGNRTRREFRLVDYHDEKNNISAMMRGTAYPTSIIAQQLASGMIDTPGVFTPEQCCDLDGLLADLHTRDVHVVETWSYQ